MVLLLSTRNTDFECVDDVCIYSSLQMSFSNVTVYFFSPTLGKMRTPLYRSPCTSNAASAQYADFVFASKEFLITSEQFKQLYSNAKELKNDKEIENIIKHLVEFLEQRSADLSSIQTYKIVYKLRPVVSKLNKNDEINFLEILYPLMHLLTSKVDESEKQQAREALEALGNIFSENSKEFQTFASKFAKPEELTSEELPPIFQYLIQLLFVTSPEMQELNIKEAEVKAKQEAEQALAKLKFEETREAYEELKEIMNKENDFKQEFEYKIEYNVCKQDLYNNPVLSKLFHNVNAIQEILTLLDALRSIADQWKNKPFPHRNQCLKVLNKIHKQSRTIDVIKNDVTTRQALQTAVTATENKIRKLPANIFTHLASMFRI